MKLNELKIKKKLIQLDVEMLIEQDFYIDLVKIIAGNLVQD
jgi:hypothetical protein